jgi:hypothetical protein
MHGPSYKKKVNSVTDSITYSFEMKTNEEKQSFGSR